MFQESNRRAILDLRSWNRGEQQNERAHFAARQVPAAWLQLPPQGASLLSRQLDQFNGHVATKEQPVEWARLKGPKPADHVCKLSACEAPQQSLFCMPGPSMGQRCAGTAHLVPASPQLLLLTVTARREAPGASVVLLYISPAFDRLWPPVPAGSVLLSLLFPSLPAPWQCLRLALSL